MGGALTHRLGFAGAPVTDPYWTSTILLCGCNGTHGAEADLDDESFANHANGANGDDAQYDTGTKMFGTASVRFDVAFNDYVRFTDHADWTLGSSDFTLEFFWRTSSATQIAQNGVIISHYNSTGNQRGWLCGYNGGDATPYIYFDGSSDGTAYSSAVHGIWTPVISTWYYICVERSGTTFRVYVGEPGGNADMIASDTESITYFNSTALLQISGASLTTAFMGGVWMDEIRLTTVARYATDAGYPVPSAAFPRS